MHPEDIAAAIRKRGTTLTALALRAGYSRSAVQLAIRHKPWPAIERVIADFLGIPPEKIWPDRYTRDGHSLVKRRGYQSKDGLRPRALCDARPLNGERCAPEPAPSRIRRARACA